ncbi:hypothetical protein ROTAS13_03980 [Roseomonas sp. TAS13]|nr:hypothetical protein ROTAS13_03980 [Roseomonas sp. TAS13]
MLQPGPSSRCRPRGRRDLRREHAQRSDLPRPALRRGRGQEPRLHRRGRPDLGPCRAALPGTPVDRGADRAAGGRGIPRHPQCRRHPDSLHGRGRVRRPGAGLPGRVRCPGRAEPGGGRRRAEARRPGRHGPWLRPQPARRGGHAGRGGGARRPGRQRPVRHGALLWLPWRGRRLRQDLHGARGRLRRPRRGRLMASGRGEQRDVFPLAGQFPGLFPLPRPRLARGGLALAGPLRARCGGADECRRELPARAHAAGLPCALRHHQQRRRLAQRGAGGGRGALPDPRPAREGGAGPVRAGEGLRRGRRDHDRHPHDHGDRQGLLRHHPEHGAGDADA